MMRISPAGIDAIKRHEGLRLFAYRDIAGVLTIGYGHTKAVSEGQHITSSHADFLLRQDLEWVEKAIAEHVKVPLTQGQYDACASFIFNLGAGAFEDSTLLAVLNAGDYAGAADQFLRWDKARVNGELRPVEGLTRRREAERAMFLADASIPPVSAPASPPRPDQEPYVSTEASMPIPALIAALLPTVVQAIPRLASIFKPGSDVAERNVAAASAVMEIVTSATGAVNAQEAVERIQTDPAARETATKAIEAQWLALTEAGGGGIDGARKADKEAMASDGPWWQVFRSPSFIVAMFLLPIVYMIVGAVVGLFGSPFSEDVRAAIANGIPMLILGGLIGYYYGQTTSRNRT